MLITFEDLTRFSAPTSKTASIDIEKYSATYGEQAAAEILLESQESDANAVSHFDVFLSHSYADARLNRKSIIQIKTWLESKHGLTVYVDWINDPLLSRASVTPATADILRKRMRQSDSLFFATSQTSNNSRWMPWELGFKDAHVNRHGCNGRCAILPIADRTASSFAGVEYLGLHPFVEEVQFQLQLSPQPKTTVSTCVQYKPWATKGQNPK